MKTNTDPQTIRTAYLNLPKPVKEWLSSETAAYLVEEINGQLGLDKEKSAVIPNLVLRLVTQDLEITNFINEISEGLSVNFQAAKAIAEDIEKKVLRPIENNLRREVGIDLKLIYFGKPRASTAAAPAAAETSAGQPLTGPASLPPVSHPTEWEKLRKAEPAAPPAPPSTPAIPLEAPPAEKPKEEPLSAEPFLLHQENYSAAEPTVKEPPKIRPDLNIKIQNYSADYSEAPKIAPKPVSAKIEIPNSEPNEQKARVVHYNEMRTPINNLGTPNPPAGGPLQNRVDLRKFTKPDINTVDLRKRQ